MGVNVDVDVELDKEFKLAARRACAAGRGMPASRGGQEKEEEGWSGSSGTAGNCGPEGGDRASFLSSQGRCSPRLWRVMKARWNNRPKLRPGSALVFWASNGFLDGKNARMNQRVWLGGELSIRVRGKTRPEPDARSGGREQCQVIWWGCS